ncbi:MAG TPA: FimV/HubP family polar landmark protein [Caldimonas sp.]|nr:FimV/HubP family polar landmark protein [Caldimonas sp.]HEX4234971.1 FimV/HubP family polar landmark protein [Caldimonas sp.]
MKRKLKLPGRFALTSVAAALCLASPLASALGLGRLNVQSALGEVLRAEIEVTSLTPEEQASLRIRVAPAEAYRAANVDYNPVLPTTRATFEKRPDGRLFVRLVSDRGVQEPFVDVILEISWATGRLVREYTLLFDPPATIRAGAQPAPGTTTSPVMSAAPSAPTPLAQSTPAMTKAEQREAARVEARERRAAARAAAAEQHASGDEAAPASRAAAATTASGEGAATSGDEVNVHSGDTLSKIAIRVQRPGVSLDQMLVSLFRANPDAFSGKNMNRLRAGVVLSVPSAETAQAVAAGEARQVITAQSADFGAYRQRLAEATTGAAPEAEPNRRRSGGKVQASVEDKKLGANASPDQLRLSKGGAMPPSAPGSAEDRMASERQRQAEAARVAELNKNLSDLNRVRGGASQASTAPATATTVTSPATAAPAAVAGARPASSPVAVVTPMPTPTAPLTAPTTTAAPSTMAPTMVGAAPPSASAATAAPAIASASMPAATASAAMVVAAAGSAAAPAVVSRPPTAAKSRPVARPPEPGFIDSITSGNPLYLGGGALALLLLGYGAYRYTQRSKKDSGETSFLESRLQPDSFFGASGGQRIDTRDAAGSSSSMTYSLSQLDAIGDVDPVAEADVYLAYGRDLQAEEILKEAMRSNPERLAIRTKLLEVYAKRRDIKGFELLATQLFALTRGEGDDWAKAQELGAQIDPDNAMYRIGGTPGQTMEGGAVAEPLGASTLPQSVMPVPSQFGSTIGNTTARDSAFDNIDLDLDNPDIGTPSRPAALDATEAIAPRPAVAPASFNTTVKMPLVANEAGAAEVGRRDEPLPFDLSGISLDLDPVETADGHNTAPAGFDDNGDPLSRKLELAEEFQRIGDKDGARDLLREVLATASGATKTKAQGMLDRIT